MSKKAEPCKCKEGKNDCHVIRMLCKEHQLSEELFCIHECGVFSE